MPGATSDGDFAIGFNGASTSLVAFGSPFEFAGVKPYTLECWLNSSGGSATPRVVVDRTFQGVGYRLYVDGPQVVAARTNADGGTSSVSALLRSGFFQHVAVVFDGTRQALFLDGTLQSTDTNGGSLGSSMTFFGVGADVEQNSNFFAGVIDEVALYDHALSSARVLAHFQAAHQ